MPYFMRSGGHTRSLHLRQNSTDSVLPAFVWMFYPGISSFCFAKDLDVLCPLVTLHSMSVLTSHCKTLEIWMTVNVIKSLLLIITVCQFSLIEDRFVFFWESLPYLS